MDPPSLAYGSEVQVIVGLLSTYDDAVVGASLRRGFPPFSLLPFKESLRLKILSYLWTIFLPAPTN